MREPLVVYESGSTKLFDHIGAVILRETPAPKMLFNLELGSISVVERAQSAFVRIVGHRLGCQPRAPVR
jgi:hypothetical protein